MSPVVPNWEQIAQAYQAQVEPESFPPMGGHMGISGAHPARGRGEPTPAVVQATDEEIRKAGFREDAHRTEVDAPMDLWTGPSAPGFHEDAHRTEVDLEDTGAALSQAQVRIRELEGVRDSLIARVHDLEPAVGNALYALIGGDGPADTTTAQLWLRTTLSPEHPNHIDPRSLSGRQGPG